MVLDLISVAEHDAEEEQRDSDPIQCTEDARQDEEVAVCERFGVFRRFDAPIALQAHTHAVSAKAQRQTRACERTDLD